MQPPPSVAKEDVSDGFNMNVSLAHLSSVFDKPRTRSQPLPVPEITALGSNTPGPSNPGHTKSISSESGSSLVERTQPSRTHPSLQAYQPHLSPRSPASTSSRKLTPQRRKPMAVPRKRSAGEHSDDEEYESEELEPLDPDATEEEKKLYARRRNTIAARRSRAKKAQEFQRLQEENTRLNREIAMWMERTSMMQRILATHGLPCPTFSR